MVARTLLHSSLLSKQTHQGSNMPKAKSCSSVFKHFAVVPANGEAHAQRTITSSAILDTLCTYHSLSATPLSTVSLTMMDIFQLTASFRCMLEGECHEYSSYKRVLFSTIHYLAGIDHTTSLTTHVTLTESFLQVSGPLGLIRAHSAQLWNSQIAHNFHYP